MILGRKPTSGAEIHTVLLLVRGLLWPLEIGADRPLLRCNSGQFSVSVSFTLHLGPELKIRNASLVEMPFFLHVFLLAPCFFRCPHQPSEPASFPKLVPCKEIGGDP